MRAAVAYCRVSHGQTGALGLGLEAQQDALARFCKSEGFTLASTYIETESGADDNRPELNKALAEAKRLRCPLMVSKLDRLSRDTHFITGLMKHRTSIVVTELGETVEPFVLQLMAVVAEQERRLISQRTEGGAGTCQGAWRGAWRLPARRLEHQAPGAGACGGPASGAPGAGRPIAQRSGQGAERARHHDGAGQAVDGDAGARGCALGWRGGAKNPLAI